LNLNWLCAGMMPSLNNMNLVILGPQGSGKGTQAKILAEKLGLYYFDMGSFLRGLAQKDENIRKIQAEGKLVPDDMFFFAMKAFMQEKINSGKGMILDGFPRTIEQYQVLRNWFEENGLSIDKVLYLTLSDEEALKRLLKRREIEGREDDTLEIINKRLAVFHEQTKPVLEQARKDGILLEIDGERPIEVIAADILEKLQ
jgi:adenylate kinase